MRTGLIAKKLGMSRVFTDEGNHVAVTVLRVDNCQVVAQRTQEQGRLHRAAARGRRRQGQERDQAAARPFRRREGRAEGETGRVPRLRGRARGGRGRDHRGAFRAGPICRRDRDQHRQGLCRRHEAAQFRRVARHPRRVGLASQPGLDRTAAIAGQDLQEQEDGRPARQRAGDDAEPRGRPVRRRARPDSDQGLGAGQRKRLGADPRRRQAQGAGWAAVPGRAARGGRRRTGRPEAADGRRRPRAAGEEASP